MNIRGKIGDFSNKFSKKTKILIASVLGGVIALSAIAAFILNNQPYETLFASLNQEESADIIGKLQESGVEYKYVNDGTIQVPKDLVEQVKAQLVSEGYPKSGFTYDVFKSNIDLMTTDFEKNNYKVFDLQNRIASTIALFDGVKDAKVTIALGDSQKYVLDNNTTEASASVVVIMQDGGSPSEEQVQGIQRLVSKSIPGLKFENIAIIDGNGREVSSTGSTQVGMSKLKIEIESEMENTIRAKIIHLLSSIYGEDNVKVSVKCTVDLDKKVKEIINYTPNADNKGIISTETIDKEIVRGDDAQGGVPGTASNADVPTYTMITPDGTEVYFKDQESRDYLVNQVKEQAQSDAGVLSDINVSVAINGVEMTDENKNEIISLVGTAAGIDKNIQNDKVAIVNLPFYEPQIDVLPDAFTADKNTWIIIGIAAAGGLLLLIITILVIRRLRKKKKKKPVASNRESREANVTEQIDTSNIGADILNIKNGRGMELKEKIRDFADDNPEISAQLIKTWLRGGNGNE